MIKTDDIFEIAKRQFFIDKFVPKLEEWKKANKDKGGTQKAFASLIEVSENMIRNYKTGDDYPRDKTMKRIISALGVSEDYFTPTTQKDLFKYSPAYMTNIAESELLPYCEEIGFDPQFLIAIRNIVGESFGDQFPIWTPIDRKPLREVMLDPDHSYEHIDPVIYWSKSAQMTPELEMFQIEVTNKNDEHEEKKLLTLSFPDIRFLRDIQDEVRKYVEYLFYKRRQELREEGEEASRRALVPLSGGGKGFKGVSPEDMNEIDKYFSNYVEKKSSREEGREKDGND